LKSLVKAESITPSMALPLALVTLPLMVFASGLVADTNRSTGDGDSAPYGKEPEGCREKEREPTDALFPVTHTAILYR